MRMDHQVDFRDRLEINTYAIDPADLFLSKLQIGNLNEKDVHDVITLVKDVYVDFQPHPGVLDLHHVAEVCAADWGLYIDVMNNIDTVVEHVADYDLSPRDAARVRRTLELAQDMMTEQAKTLRWRLRARIGKRVRWYSEVEEQFGGRTEDVALAVRTKSGRAAGYAGLAGGLPRRLDGREAEVARARRRTPGRRPPAPIIPSDQRESHDGGTPLFFDDVPPAAARADASPETPRQRLGRGVDGAGAAREQGAALSRSRLGSALHPSSASPHRCRLRATS